MSSTQLIDIVSKEAVFPPSGAIPVLNLPDRQDRDDWIGRIIRAKRPFAIASPDVLSAEETRRLAETGKRRKLPIAILGAYRLIPVFSRLKEIVVSGCVGTLTAIHVRIPAAVPPCLGADLALWLSSSASSESLAASDDDRLVVTIDGTNGGVSASLDWLKRESSLSVTIAGTTRESLISWSDPQKAERDILANTVPAHHRWILLMHADDAANAIALSKAFGGESQKIDALA